MHVSYTANYAIVVDIKSRYIKRKFNSLFPFEIYKPIVVVSMKCIS